jgi:penicillin-binding protein-related factor A (putative recombinase)
MSKQHGYDFEKEIGKSFELLKTEYSTYRNLWYYKLVDTYAYDWIRDYIDTPPKSLDVRQTAQFKYQMVLPKVPADFLVLLRGRCAFVECKSSRDSLGFPIANIKDHQLSMAEEIEMAGVPYYFYICKREARHNVMYVLRSGALVHMIQVLKSGKLIKSKLLWKNIEAAAEHIVCKGRGCVFDLEPVLRAFSQSFSVPGQ